MRKLLVAVAVIIAVIIVALLAIPKFVNLEQYRGKIQAQLQQKLGRNVTFGQMHLSLLPLAFRVNNATIGEDPNFGTQQFASVQQLEVHAKLLPLLRGDVEISSVRLDRPTIELIRNQQGVWNFSSLGQQKTPSSGNKNDLVLDDLKINDGTVALTDMQKHQSRAVYDHIDLELKNFARDRQFQIAATAHLPGQGKQVATLNATAGPLNDAEMLKTPFDGQLKLDHVALNSIEKFLNSEALAGTDAIASGDMHLRNENGKMASNGTLRLEQARVKGVDIGYPLEANYNLTDDLASDMLQINKGDLKFGSTPISVTGTVNSRPTPALVDVKLNASDVSLAEIAKLAGAFGVGLDPNMQVAGRATADVHAQGATNNPVLNGNVSAKDVAVTGGGLPVPVKVPGITLALTPQAIQSNDFTANAGGTNVASKFTLTQYATPSPMIDATLRTANANIADLIAMARAWNVQAVDGMNGSGLLNLDVHAQGPVKQSDRMTFAGTGKIANAQIKPATLTQPLNVRNADIVFNSNAATLNNLQASLGHTNASGTATVRNFQAPNVQFNLTADQVNVAELQQITSAPPPQPQHRAGLIPAANAAPAAQPSMLAKMTGGGTISVGRIINDQLTLDNVRSNVALDHGVVRMNPVTALLYGGQLNGNVTANTLTTPMTVQLATKLNNVDANRLLSATTSLKDTVYGLLASNANISFAAGSSNDLTRTLNGTLALNLANGKIAKIDLLNQLASIGKFTGARQNTAATNVAKLNGTFDVRNGVATTNNLQAVIDGGTVAANGAVNLIDQSMNLHVTAVLSKGMTNSVGGTGVGGFMQTALANNRGELVMPVIVTGTFDHPNFAPDVNKLAQMKLQNLLPTTGNPGQMTSGVVGALLGGKGGQQQGQAGGLGGIVGSIAGRSNQQQAGQQQQQQQQQGNPLSDALGGLFGGKKKK